MTSACRKHGIVQRAAERVLHEQLLQLKVGLSHRHSLLVRGHGALRAYRFNGGETADFNLFLGVGKRLLGKRQRFFFHALVLVGIDEIPVHVLDLIDGGDNLQAESHVGKFAVVFGDADEASVGRKSKTLQKMLSHSGLEAGVQGGLRLVKEAVRGAARVVEAHNQVGSPVESLLVGEINRARVLSQLEPGRTP